MKTKEQSKGVVWYGLRISFWTMVLLWLGFAIISPTAEEYWQGGTILFTLIWCGSGIFCFVTSIIHLTKYKKKAFAITSLVLSSYFILTFIIGLLFGLLVGV